MASKIPAWGLRRTVCFSGHNFEFDFLLAAVATPILGMDFLARFELSIIPAKKQVLHAASGHTFTKASTTSFINPWSPETAAAVAALPPQVQQLLEEFPSLLHPCAAPPKPLHGVVHHIDTGSAAPVFARPGRLDPEKHRIAEEEFLALEKQALFAAQTRPGRPHCTWSPRMMSRSASAATIAALTPSQYPKGTPSPTCSPSMTAWPGALFFRKST
jgi:hypothetical protein